MDSASQELRPNVLIREALERLCEQKHSMNQEDAVADAGLAGNQVDMKILAEWRDQLPASNRTTIHSEDCNLE